MVAPPTRPYRQPSRPQLQRPQAGSAAAYGTGDGQDFRFASPAASEAWIRDAYGQAVNAGTWHLGDRMDNLTRDTVLAGLGGPAAPFYRGADGAYYFHNARTTEDAATRAHRARYLAGKSLDEIAAAKVMPGADEYVAMRRAREQAEADVKPPVGVSAPANDNRLAPGAVSRVAPANDNAASPKVAARRGHKSAVDETAEDSAGVTFTGLLQAADDSIRLAASGATGGYADEFAARADAFLSTLFGGDYDAALAENLKSELAKTAAARERLGAFGTAVETAPGFVPGIGDLSGLAADFKDYLENGDYWTAADWALVAAGVLPGAPNRRTAKSGEKIVDDLLKRFPSKTEALEKLERRALKVCLVQFLEGVKLVTPTYWKRPRGRYIHELKRARCQNLIAGLYMSMRCRPKIPMRENTRRPVKVLSTIYKTENSLPPL